MTHYLVLFVLSLVPVLGCASTAPSTTTSSHATPPLEVGGITHVVEGPTEEEDEQNPGPYRFTLPLVRGGAPGVAERINEAFAFDRFMRHEITGSSFSVAFRRGRLLAIEVYSSPTCGSYCSQNEVSTMLFDTDTGASLSEFFDDERLPALSARVETIRLAIAQAALDDLSDERREKLGWFPDVLNPYFGDHRGLGSARFSDTGVAFATDYDFPHYAKALEPAGPSMTWAEIAPYLAPSLRELLQ